jgi:hypothetical protein
VPALTTREFQFAMETETVRRDPLWDAIFAEERREEEREARNEAAREMLSQLRAMERYASAANRAGCGYLNAQLQQIIRESRFDSAGNLHLDTEAAERVLAGFVGLTTELRLRS